MKKIALFFALLAGMFTSAMAEESKDSVFVVDANGTIVGKHEIADGAYITFTHPTEWREIIKDASTYFYDGSTYNVEYTYKTTIYQDRDKNYFYVDNFLNSGTGFTFKIMNSDGTSDETIADFSAKDGYIMPVDLEGCELGTDFGTCTWVNYYSNGSYTFNDTVNNLEKVGWGFYAGDGYSSFKGSAKWLAMAGYFYLGDATTYTTLYIQW